MSSVGIRDLKARLSYHLKRVRAGARLTVTERGRSIATISPMAVATDVSLLHDMVDGGLASWGGGKPAGAPHRIQVKGGKLVSDAVLEDRE